MDDNDCAFEAREAYLSRLANDVDDGLPDEEIGGPYFYRWDYE
jgi:hypothetical protein